VPNNGADNNRVLHGFMRKSARGRARRGFNDRRSPGAFRCACLPRLRLNSQHVPSDRLLNDPELVNAGDGDTNILASGVAEKLDVEVVHIVKEP
jgi:hypothetical protein